MKAAERRKLLAYVRGSLPQLATYSRMAIEEPPNRILRGIYLEDSSDSMRSYAWMFVQPLFEPPPFVVSFYLGQRLGGPNRTWTISDGVELATKASKEGPAFWGPASSPAGLANWSYIRENADPYAMRARAFALIACHEWSEASRVLEGLRQNLKGGVGWMAKMLEQCESVNSLIARRPDEAAAMLRHWEAENIRQLRLASPGC